MTEREQLQTRVDAFMAGITHVEADLTTRANDRLTLTRQHDAAVAALQQQVADLEATYVVECGRFEVTTEVLTQQLNERRTLHSFVRDVVMAVDEILDSEPELPPETAEG